MDLYMYYDWIHNLNILIVMYSVLYTLYHCSVSVLTKVECQSALLKGWQIFCLLLHSSFNDNKTLVLYYSYNSRPRYKFTIKTIYW